MWQDAQSAESRFAWIVRFTRAIRDVPFVMHHFHNEATFFACSASKGITGMRRSRLTPRKRMYTEQAASKAPQLFLGVLR